MFIVLGGLSGEINRYTPYSSTSSVREHGLRFVERLTGDLASDWGRGDHHDSRLVALDPVGVHVFRPV